MNIDYFATDEALKIDPSGESIKVCLPITLEGYSAHYRKRAEEGVITMEQAEKLITQLQGLRSANLDAIFENTKNEIVDKIAYYERNTRVVDLSDELLTFQVNGSRGVQDTIDKALSRGKSVRIRKYVIT